MSKNTPLYAQHLAAGAKMVDFAGYLMPLHYGSQLHEHQIVRQDAGMFDVSHMAVIDIQGTNSTKFLRYLLANDVAKLTLPGKALYTCMLNENAGIIDDLIVYFIKPDFYRLVVNAGTREKDLEWINKQAVKFDIDLNERTDLSIIAIQGPNARLKTEHVLSAGQEIAIKDLKPFQGVLTEDFWIARTGYTGEDGYEIILPNQAVETFWQKLIVAQISPCGLGARDTLRLEAGLNLYGSDMDESTSPLESNLAWTIAWEPADRDFIGREALQNQLKNGITRVLVGLVLTQRGVLRGHQKVLLDEAHFGEITSGTFSPTLNQSIALARIPLVHADTCQVQIRDKCLTARIVKPPFVKNGKSLITLI
ncbi:MAG: glycine cleavage system aminomethyltransferase GcvT [Gammaproteobacteria bacterium]